MDLLERDVKSIPCPKCNGYSDKVECTKEEVKNQKCNRKYECCVAAYLCRVCKTRTVAELLAPDCNW